MGEARRWRDRIAAFEALPLHLRQPPLPAVICPCLRPGWNVRDVMEALEHTRCRMPDWLTNIGQADLCMGWMSAAKSSDGRAGKNPPHSGGPD